MTLTWDEARELAGTFPAKARINRIIPRYRDRRDRPLRRVVRDEYTSIDGGVTLYLECGHSIIRPRRRQAFECERARCPFCEAD